MKYEVDSYILEYIENEEKYYISFKDSVGNNCKLEISKEIFDGYMQSKKSYVKIKNETSRYLEHKNFTEEEIYNKAISQKESVEEIVLKNIEKEQLNRILKLLTETQYKRINLHIVNDITIRDLAKLENVRKNQIEKSIKLGLGKLKKFFDI